MGAANPRRVPVKRTETEAREIFQQRYDEGVRLAQHHDVPLFVGLPARRELFSKYGLPTPPPLDDLEWLGYARPQIAALNGCGPSTYWENDKVVGYWVADVDDTMKKWRERPAENPADQIKRRLLDWNPPSALPVIKRGMYPQFIVGQTGVKAIYRYRGWDLEVLRNIPDLWDVNIVSPTRAHGRDEFSSSPTFEGALCVGKITVDLQESLRSLSHDEERFLRRMWKEIVCVVLAEMQDTKVYGPRHSPPPTRASTARWLETRRMSHGWYATPGTAPPEYGWWDGLPLRQRVQLIDDVLQYLYCRQGTDPRLWP